MIHIHELGHVVLYVTNLDRAVVFYRDILGMNHVGGMGKTALFSGGRTHHELFLIEIGGIPRPQRIEPGLYHIGFKIGDGWEKLREAYLELLGKQVPVVGSADHGITHSLYVLDPDGNEIELYVDVSDEWKNDPTAILRPPQPLSYLA